MTVRLLYNVGDELKGAVLAMDERRAQRLIQTGYAEAVEQVEPPKKTRTRAKE